MTRYIPIMLMALTIMACSKENTSTGCLSFGITGQGTEISTHTKSLSEEVLDNFYIQILPDAEIPSGYYRELKDKKFVIPANTPYKVTAQSCSEETANGAGESGNLYGCIRYAGECEFSIEPGEFSTVEIPCSISNSQICVTLKDNFLKACRTDATTVTVATNSNMSDRPLTFSNFVVSTQNNENSGNIENQAVPMTQPNGSEVQYAYYPAATALYIKIYTRLAYRPVNETKTFMIEQPITTVAAHKHTIVIDADLSNAPTGISVQVNEIIDVVDNSFSIDKYTSGTLTEDE